MYAVLGESNAIEIRNNSRFVLAKYRRNLASPEKIFQRNGRDISLGKTKPLTKVRGGENSSVPNFVIARRTLAKCPTYKVQRNTAKN